MSPMPFAANGSCALTVRQPDCSLIRCRPTTVRRTAGFACTPTTRIIARHCAPSWACRRARIRRSPPFRPGSRLGPGRTWRTRWSGPVHGYRPGSLEGLGLTPASIAERHPHLVTASLSAWGDAGPWAGRRGFDSIVRAASGIAELCRTDADPGALPGALPAQLLDHATGHLVAAAALPGLEIRETEGTAAHARASLAGTAAYLMSALDR